MTEIRTHELASLLNRTFFSGRKVIAKDDIRRYPDDDSSAITQAVLPDSVKSVRFSTKYGDIHIMEC